MTDFLAAASFSLCALAFLALAVLGSTVWRRQILGPVLPLACLLQSLWAASILYNGLWDPLDSNVLLGFDLVRALGWIALLASALLLRVSRNTRRGVVLAG